jgi:hypothetical protein
MIYMLLSHQGVGQIPFGRMKRSFRKIIISFFLLPCSFLLFLSLESCFSQQEFYSNAYVVINEVQANEPSSFTKLEWVELYNADSISHDLDGWIFVCKEDSTHIPPNSVIPAGGFLILARQLFTDPPDSISFEGWWGNRSGIWGDSPEENYPALQADMSLTNSGGTVSLLDPDNNAQTFTWDKDCGDGTSWERVSPDQDIWLCCTGPDKSTPGRKNSVSTDYSNKIDLNIEPNPFSPDEDGYEDEVTFRYTIPLNSELTLKIYDVKGRLIKTLAEDQSQASGEITWDGRDNDNTIVRIGIYIVWAEVKGSSHGIKKMTVVVAKK